MMGTSRSGVRDSEDSVQKKRFGREISKSLISNDFSHFRS